LKNHYIITIILKVFFFTLELFVAKNSILLSNLFFFWFNLFKIYFIKNLFHLKFILLNVNFNIIYILYILWIEYSFSKFRVLNIGNPKNPIEIINLNF